MTRIVASRLAELAKHLEEDHPPEAVAGFLMRCIFTSFAEDVHLLPADSWTNLLESLRTNVASFGPMVESLWQTMNSGGFSPILREDVLRFNGGLFESVQALPITASQLDLLIQASKADWKDVEPSIFGTLLERALDRQERHRLGAHYTPREYVERLVVPTIVQPLRDDWKTVQAAAVKLSRDGNQEGAIRLASDFRKYLCEVRILDPAGGSGNFLYVALEHLKRLEGEVIEMLEQFTGQHGLPGEPGRTVDPHQLLGLELNPRAAIITDLVLWIGYLQWYFRTWGSSAIPPEPVIKRFHNIEPRDALLTYDREQPVRDEHGAPRTQWDQRTMRRHPVIGKEVPDEGARRPVSEYINARPSAWPEADFIVGNPPFIGNRMMRRELGDGYTDSDGADVRISMAVGQRGTQEGVLARVIREAPGPLHAEVELQERRGIINPDLTVGPNLATAQPLQANADLSCRGVSLHGAGFIVNAGASAPAWPRSRPRIGAPYPPLPEWA